MDAVERVMGRINSMVGLGSVKDELQDLVFSALVDAEAAQDGKPPSVGTMHLVFEGPSGTGKTSVAEEISPLYYALGLVPTQNFKSILAGDLRGEAVGVTAQKVREVFYGNEKKGIPPGVGGVVFIDEAYALVPGRDDSYGKEAIAAMLPILEKHRDDTVVILAGYDKGNQTMDNLMKVNPGLPSRFPRTLYFESYDDKERMQIAEGIFAESGKTLGSSKSAAKVRAALRAGIRQTGGGNARDVRELVTSINRAQTSRLGTRMKVEGWKPTAKDRELITVDDVNAGVARFVSGRRRQDK